MTEYAQQVCFLPLYEGCEDKGRLAEDCYWPCVLFADREEFASHQADLLDHIGHNEEIQRTTTNDLLVFRESPHAEGSKFAYLLGGKKFPSNVLRLRWTRASVTNFEEGYFLAMEASTGMPGFRDALKDALLLVYGPEFSRTRLRFGHLPLDEIEQAGGSALISPKQMWPCLLFDDYLQLTAGLRERNLLSGHEEVELSRMFVPLSQSEETRNPPYVYFFGRQHVGHCIDAFDDSLEDFKENLFDAMMDNMSKKPFMSALFEAMEVVSDDTDGKKYFPFAVDTTDQEQGEDVSHGNENNLVAGLPVSKGTLRVDFGQNQCTRCTDGTGLHAKTCAAASDNWYLPPKPALLAMLTETQYKILPEATKKRIRSLGLEKHLGFMVGGKRKNTIQTPLRHSKRTSAAVAASTISPNEAKSSS